MSIDVERFARNCVRMLQQQPERYLAFGVYWWTVKAVLKHFHTRDELYLLGDYIDPVGLDAVPKTGLQETLRLALEEQERNARDHMLPRWTQAPDGADYYIYDEDAGR